MNILYYRKSQPTLASAFDRHAVLQDELSRLFEDGISKGVASLTDSRAPALDLYEDEEHFTVKVELPGFKKENVNISLHQGALTISGERFPVELLEGQKMVRNERPFGKFETTVRLESTVNSEEVTATYTDGILTVQLRKTEESKPKQIAVQIAES